MPLLDFTDVFGRKLLEGRGVEEQTWRRELYF